MASLIWVVVLAVVIVNLAFSYGVVLDSSELMHDGVRVQLAPAWAWILATVLFGPPAAVLYWVVNRSRLSFNIASDGAPPQSSDPVGELFEGRKGKRPKS